MKGASLTLMLMLAVLMAANAVSALDNVGTYAQNATVDISHLCSSCSYSNITVQYPNGTLALSNVDMSQANGLYTYSFSQTSLLGNYLVSVLDNNTLSEFQFSVTPYGSNLTVGQSILYLGFFAFFVLLFFGTLAFSFRLPSGVASRSESGELLGLSAFRYVRPVAFFFSYMILVLSIGFFNVIAGNYLDLAWSASTFSVIFYISLIGILPAFTIVSWRLVVNFITSKELKRTLKFKTLG